MDYKQTVEWLFSKLPMYQRVGKAAYKADLSNTIQLLELLGNPQQKFKAIHIAGTNGKGSVAHIIASILQEAGYKTGLYTSPHLKDFRERIKIDGKIISEENVTSFVSSNKSNFEKVNPSFFEMTVGMAFDHFAKEKVDIAVLETGMGGRLDSTNVSHPILTIITNIGYDHMQFLGETIEEIATEKAGIIKESVPIIVGKTQTGAREVFEKKAELKKTKLIFADAHFDLREIHTREKDNLIYDVWLDHQMYLEKMESPLLGNYQGGNIATSLQAADLLVKDGLMKIDHDAIRNGILNIISNTGLQGRWQILSRNPLTICDTAHNPEGIQAVVDQLSQNVFDHLHMVFGMVDDKNPDSILFLLPKNATYYFCKPDIPRGMDAEKLKELAFKAGLRGEQHNSVKQALNSAVNNAGVKDLVFVGGSTFVVAEIV